MWGAIIGAGLSLIQGSQNRRAANNAAAADRAHQLEMYNRQLADSRVNQSNPWGSVTWGKDKWGNPVRQVSMNQQDADRLAERRSINAQRMANAGRVKLPEANSFDYSQFMRGGTGSSRGPGQALARLEAQAAPAAGYSEQYAPRTVWDGEPAPAPAGGNLGGDQVQGPMAQPKAMIRNAALGGQYLG